MRKKTYLRKKHGQGVHRSEVLDKKGKRRTDMITNRQKNVLKI